MPQGKVRLYEPSIRVPLLIRAPGMPKGVHRSQPVANVDLARDDPRLRPRQGRPQGGRRCRSLRSWRRSATGPGRGLDLETYFTPDTHEDPEDPPLNYQGVRTDRYLYAQLRHRRAGALRPAKRPVRAPERGRQSRLRARSRARSSACSADWRTAPARRCRARPAVEAEGAGLLDGARSPARASRRRRPSTCAARRSAATRSRRSACSLHHASSGVELEAVASSLDGRTVSLTRKLRGC